jgi:hypothetical protein
MESTLNCILQKGQSFRIKDGTVYDKSVALTNLDKLNLEKIVYVMYM